MTKDPMEEKCEEHKYHKVHGPQMQCFICGYVPPQYLLRPTASKIVWPSSRPNRPDRVYKDQKLNDFWEGYSTGMKKMHDQFMKVIEKNGL